MQSSTSPLKQEEQAPPRGLRVIPDRRGRRSLRVLLLSLSLFQSFLEGGEGEPFFLKKVPPSFSNPPFRHPAQTAAARFVQGEEMRGRGGIRSCFLLAFH